MSTTPTSAPTMTMIDPSGSARLVPADGAADATQAGWKAATKMIDPKGTPRWIPSDGMDDAKNAGYVLHPDSMQPPVPTKRDDTSMNGGFGTAALPKDFKGDPNKYGQLATDEEVDARARATNAALTPAQKKALHFSDATEVNAGMGMAALSVPAIAAVAAPAAAAAPGAGLRYLGRAALPGMEEMAGKQALKQGAAWAAKKLMPHVAPAAGLGVLAKILGLF